jgi:sialate O-acetylesterase
MRLVKPGVAALLLASAASAAPTLDPMFADHAVIQRDSPIQLRGTATPGERLTVSFGGRSRSTRADGNGRWTAGFGTLPAGGPYHLEAIGAGGKAAAADDVMVGDVWLCSGQSNMEYPLRNALNGEAEVAGAADPLLRLMKVPHNRQIALQDSFARDVTWKPASPESAKDFSAACYFIARALRQAHGVAIGAIDSSWGGTAIATWMDEAAVRATGGGTDVDLLREYRSDPEGTKLKFDRRWEDWWRQFSGTKPGEEPWRTSDQLKWTPVPKIAPWEQWGDPDLAEFDGAMWARLRFTLTADEAAKGAALHLGAIDDFDRTYVNGERVGSIYMYSTPRDYALPPGLLKPGVNEVMVYILDTGGGGGFSGPADRLKLSFADGSEKSLGRGWEYSIIGADVSPPPLPPWNEAPGPTTLYNGMIAPIGRFHLKGAAWYQGEADVGKSGYDRRLAAMMKSWRGQFGDPSLPFLIVGLAGFGQPVTAPTASNWAALINEQRKAVDSDARTALMSAIDIGERNDIHPANKQEVGRRLTLAAEALAYGRSDVALTPRVLSAARVGPNVVVRFDRPLVTYSGASALGFELCGETQESCRYAMAASDGANVVITGDGRPTARIRYAWANYPIVNLYGAGRLPVPPFEVPIAP